MTSPRINYNTPLKSVRTIRALKIDQYDPRRTFGDDPARLSDADLMNEAGIAFVWEDVPGRSKVEQEKGGASSPVELQPPPQQVLTPPPSSKVPFMEFPKSPPPAGSPSSGEAHARPSYSLFGKIPAYPPKAVVDTSVQKLASHQRPPKPSQNRAPPATVQPQQSGDKLAPKPRKTASVPVGQSGHHDILPPSRSGVHDQQQPGQRAVKTRGQEISVSKEKHHHSSLAATLYALTNDDDPAPLPDLNGGRNVLSFPPPDEGTAAAIHTGLNHGSQDYLAERLRQSPVVGVKDFYMSGRLTPPSTLTSSAHATRPSSCMPTRPNSASASEAGDDDDECDQTDAGDAFSQMNMNSRDPDGRCQVSILDGEQHESSRHTDPRARDFIMERFLPAAKAMVTETAEVSDRRSAQDNPSLSPTRGKGRTCLIGRSRFAFKDQFAEEELQEDQDHMDMLFKHWQTGSLRHGMPHMSAPTDSRSVEQSPSTSFGNSKECSSSPSASFGNRKEPSPSPYQEGHHDGPWAYAESDGSATPKGDSTGSFEDRRLPPKSRNSNKETLSPIAQFSGIGEVDYLNSDGSFFVGGESGNVGYEGEYSGRSNDTSSRAFPGVPKDRLNETAAQGDFEDRNKSNGCRTPEMQFSGNLGTLLRSSQLQRRDLGKTSEAAVMNIQEPIPPSSILNHQRYDHSHAAGAAGEKSLAYSGQNSSANPSYSSDGAFPDESNSYHRHLKLNLVRQQIADPSGGSGGSLESLNDEVWEAGREANAGSKCAAAGNYGAQGKVLATNNLNLPESTSDNVNTAGWPLGKGYSTYARTTSSDSKDASFSSLSDLSLRSPTNVAASIELEKTSTEKHSPVSVLPPPLPKSPAESWLFKVRTPVPPSTGSNWRGPKPKKFLDYSLTDDSMDVKWEVLVKSESSQLRSKLTQEAQRKAPGLEKSEILGSKAR